MSDGRFYFADADDGRIAYTIDAFRSQAAVGGGIGYKGVRKKMSTTRAGSRYEAHDLLRPGAIVTLDGRLNTPRVYRLLYDHFLEGLPEGEPLWTPHDIATDADNDWHDPAVVDGHAHTGWTYDYFFQRHGWKGIDGEDGRILSIVNLPVRNAFFFSPPYGPEGTGVMVYGRAEFATSEEPWTNLDTVGHEMMHGVAFHALNRRTESPFGLANDVAASSRLGPPSFIDGGGKTHTCATARFPGRIATPDGWKNVPLPAFCVDGRFVLSSHQGWSIDEGYADIMAQAVEFFHVNAGATADYLVEGDQGMPIIRSPVDPRSIPLSPVIPQWRYPDTYGDRYEFALVRSDEGFVTFSPFVFSDGQFAFALGGPGYGGSHWNSTILSHAFYLAIEGGTHRTSGMTVEGVGGANRDEIERIFFRALTDLMPAATSFPMAAAVLRQSAADLAPGSDGERAVEEALRAVGLPPSR